MITQLQAGRLDDRNGACPLPDYGAGYGMQLIDCDRGPPLYDLGCDGGDFEGGIRYIAQNGVDLESDYPYLAKDGACRCGATGHAACFVTESASVMSEIQSLWRC